MSILVDSYFFLNKKQVLPPPHWILFGISSMKGVNFIKESDFLYSEGEQSEIVADHFFSETLKLELILKSAVFVIDRTSR